MEECNPPFIFGHRHRFASGKVSVSAAALWKRLNPERLLQGCLDISTKGTIEAAYPEEFFAPSLFTTTPKQHPNLLEHVKYECIFGNRLFSTGADESD
ncbi:hypothetical protein TWF281_004762 [Arthrobotrys megalospora]